MPEMRVSVRSVFSICNEWTCVGISRRGKELSTAQKGGALRLRPSHDEGKGRRMCLERTAAVLKLLAARGGEQGRCRETRVLDRSPPGIQVVVIDEVEPRSVLWK